jgi:hypothetical protein
LRRAHACKVSRRSAKASRTSSCAKRFEADPCASKSPRRRAPVTDS